jgi:hypothetical protein
MYRGITIHAPAAIIFRWLCQMRLAPYSYDWIDHRGQRSPQQLTPGLDKLALGQEFMEIFELVDFAQDGQLTLRMKPSGSGFQVFGDVVVSYHIQPEGSDICRLLVKLVVRYPAGIRGHFMRILLPWGDLIMMRRQLLNFKALAERTTQ